MVVAHILNCVDEKYAEHCGPFWLSILDHFGSCDGSDSKTTNSEGFLVHFHLFFDGPADAAVLAQLTKFVACFNKKQRTRNQGNGYAELTVYLAKNFRLGEHLIDHAAAAHWPDVVLARLFAGTIVSLDVQRLLYLDVDMAAVGDLSPLFRLDMQGCVIAAVRNDCFRSTYFNSGMILIDLVKWRAGKFERQLVEAQHCLADALLYPDQDVLNEVFHRLPQQVLLVSCKWNWFHLLWIDCAHRVHCTSPTCLSTDANAVLTDRRIVHFMGGFKHWNQPYSSIYTSSWAAGENDRYFSYSRMRKRFELVCMVPPCSPTEPKAYAVGRYMKGRLKFWLGCLLMDVRDVKRAACELDALMQSDGALLLPKELPCDDVGWIKSYLTRIVLDGLAVGLDRKQVWAVVQYFITNAKCTDKLVWLGDSSSLNTTESSKCERHPDCSNDAVSDDGSISQWEQTADIKIALGWSCTVLAATGNEKLEGSFTVQAVEQQTGFATLQPESAADKSKVAHASLLRPHFCLKSSLSKERPVIAVVHRAVSL